MYFITGIPKPFSCGPEERLEDVPDALAQMRNNPIIIVAITGVYCDQLSVFDYNMPAYYNKSVFNYNMPAYYNKSVFDYNTPAYYNKSVFDYNMPAYFNKSVFDYNTPA